MDREIIPHHYLKVIAMDDGEVMIKYALGMYPYNKMVCSGLICLDLEQIVDVQLAQGLLRNANGVVDPMQVFSFFIYRKWQLTGDYFCLLNN